MWEETFMKRILFVTILILIAFSTVYGQLGFRTGLKAGYSMANLAGDDFDDFKAREAITGGVALEFNLLIISFQIEALYSPRGAVFEGDETNLNYISVPILVKKKFLPLMIHPYIFGGPEFNYLLSAKAGDVDIKEHLNKQDLAAVGGAGLEFSLVGKSVYIEARYSYGLNKINKESGFGDAKNRVSQIFVGILF